MCVQNNTLFKRTKNHANWFRHKMWTYAVEHDPFLAHPVHSACMLNGYIMLRKASRKLSRCRDSTTCEPMDHSFYSSTRNAWQSL